MKSLSALLRGITSNHNGDFYCVKCFHSYSTKNKLKRYERGCTDHDYCHVDMPNEGNKVLKYKKGANSLKAPIMIYVHLECLLEKMRSCQNNLKNLTQRKKLSIRLLVTHYLQVVHLIKQKNNLTVTEAKTVWKGFCKRLRDHVMKIINYEEKEMILLTDKENKSYEMQKVCYIRKKIFFADSGKKHHKVKDHCHYTGIFRGAAHNICNLRYKTPKEIPVAFHKSSTYDYYFTINKLAKECNGQLECLGESTEKYITFSVLIRKELDNDKKITYKLKLITSFRFMSISLSSLVDNLSEI